MHRTKILIVVLLAAMMLAMAGCTTSALTTGASGVGGLLVGYNQAIVDANQTIQQLNQQVTLTQEQISGLQSGLLELSKDPNKMAAFQQIITMAQSGGLVDANSAAFANQIAQAYFNTYTMTGQTKQLISEWPKAMTGTGIISLLLAGYALAKKNGWI
ncbi:MAG: hypothetical protein ABSG22_10675 [Sedimentisphaerales bacterium]